MAHLLKYGDVLVDFPGGFDLALLQVPGVAQKDGHAELVVQETALDEAGLRHNSAGIEGYDVSRQDTQGQDVILALHQLVQDHLHHIVGAGGGVVIAVDMDGSVFHLEGTGVGLSVTGVDPAVLRLAVVGVHAPQRAQGQPAIAADRADHAAQGVHVGLEQDGSLLRLTGGLSAALVDTHQDAALVGENGLVAQLAVFVHHKVRGPGGKPGGTVNGEDLHCFFYDIICESAHKNPSFLKSIAIDGMIVTTSLSYKRQTCHVNGFCLTEKGNWRKLSGNWIHRNLTRS